MATLRVNLALMAAAILFAGALPSTTGSQEDGKARPGPLNAEDHPPTRGRTSFIPTDDHEKLPQVMAKLKAEKAGVMQRQKSLLEERYDLSNRSAADVKMTRGKAVQQGIRVKLPAGATWDALGRMSPDEIRQKGHFPKGFLPLPHTNHPEGGMVFPKFDIDELIKQEARDLTRFDLEFDLPDHLVPEFPPAIFLTTRPDLGDVSQGKRVTLANFEELFRGILNPKQLDGWRLLLTPFPQQQFNFTGDRRSEHPSRGVACFDCHVNGHTSAAFHPVADERPQEFRRRVDTVSLRGVNIQRLFGSKRALKTVEDFTEFEQRGAYFDADPPTANKKGINPLERGTQVHHMAEVQQILDFPPAPKLGWDGKLDPRKASEQELRGQEVFFGKARCATCHPAPYYTDNLMHNLRTERFFSPQMINGRWAAGDGPIKTFVLRGIKDSPPYLHDGRLLTLEDAIEFFNLVLELKLTEEEKKDLLAFLKQL